MTWWQRLFRRRRMEEQLEKELRFHLEQHASDLMARGCEPGEARRQARLALGGPEQVKEECRDARGTRWLEELWQDTRYALRILRQKPGFAAVALLTLALGSGATTVMFTVIDGVLFKPLSYPEPERLVTLHERVEKSGLEWPFAYPNFLDCQRENHSLAPMAAWKSGGGMVSDPGEAEYASARQISAGLFAVLGVDLVRGRSFTSEEDRPGAAPVAIIGSRLWQRRFGGNPQAIGRPLVFGGKSYTVVGVAPAGLGLFGDADVFTSMGQSDDPTLRNREMHPGIHVIARLRRGVTLPQAQAELAVIGRRLAQRYPKSNAGRDIGAVPLRRELTGEVRPTLWLLFGAVSLVLLIACVNVASLLLARAVSRERELAMRTALGAGRGRLVRQCLAESTVLGLSGGVLGVVLATQGTRPFLMFWPGGLPRAEDVRFDWRVLLFALSASLLCGLLFGLAPALRAPVRNLEQTLRAGGRTIMGSSRRLHCGFVISEIALAVVLLVSAGTLGFTLLRSSSVDPGIDVRNVLVARVALSPNVLESPADTRAAWRGLLERVRTVPGVRSAAISDVVPMEGDEEDIGYWTTATPPPANQVPYALLNLVTPDYLPVMGIRLRKGRIFNELDRVGSEPVVVIDEAMAQRAFAGRDPIGERLTLNFLGAVRVVGVARHVLHSGLGADESDNGRDQVYVPFAQLPDAFLRLTATAMHVEVRTQISPLSVVAALRRQVRGATRDQALYDVRTMEQIASGTLARQRFLLMLFGIFAGLALLLACIGIYGVLAYLTSQRAPEFGVRMALGASGGGVMRMVLRQSLGMIAAGAGLGIAGALAAGRVLERFVAGVRPADPPTFAVMICVLVLAALLASFVPARRASRIDPMSALRQE